MKFLAVPGDGDTLSVTLAVRSDDSEVNLLATPADLMGDAELIARMAEVMAEPDAWPAPPREGPKREQLLEALDAREPAA